MWMFIWLTTAILLLVDGLPVADICQVVGKQNGDKYRVNCTQGDIVSLSSLVIPSYTTQLSITGNGGLTAIGKDDLLSLTNLDKLNLSGNSISSIAANAFRDLEKLTKLDLSNNRLTAINSSTFSGLRNLKRLSLSGNLLETLPQAAFSPLTQLMRVDFASANLVCDCRLKWTIQWIIDTKVNVADTVCTAPSDMKDILVKNLNRDNLKCEWPVNLERFELMPSSKSLLVFKGDNLPLKCLASKERLRGLYWYRQGLRVVSNATAKISVENRTDSSTFFLTLRLSDVAADMSGTWTCAAVTDHGNVTKSINIVVAPAFCPQVTNVTKKGTYSWPKAGYNSRKRLHCTVKGGMAYHSCNDRGQWVDLDLEACKYESSITQLLSGLSLADFNISNNLNHVKTLMDMLSQPTDNIADKMDVVFIARVLRKISSSYDLYSKAEIPQMVYNITSLMMNINSSLLLEAEKEEKSCTIMRDNLETVVSFMLESQNQYDLYMGNIALQSFKLNPHDSFAGLTCSAHDNLKGNKTYRHSNFFCTMQELSLETSIKQTVDAMVRIPSEVTKSASSQRAMKLVVIIYRNDSLFQRNTSVDTRREFVPSSVISAKIIGVTVKDLTSSVNIALRRQDYSTMVPKVQAVYWNPMESTWNTNGCLISNTVEKKYHNLSLVDCDHLASFALLQEEPMVLTTTQPPPLIYFVHKPQFYVGAVFLCICLLAVILTYILSYRTINVSTRLKHALINTCFSILFLKVIFILGVKTHHIECKIIGMAIHYFSITTIFWITVSTWNIYRKVSGRTHRPLQTEDGSTPLPPNPMLKFYLFAWGVPVIVCGITGAVNINLSDPGNSDYCFIDWDPGKAAFFVVVGLCAIGNFFLYICICTSKSENRAKMFADEMTVLNADGLLEPQAMDDSISVTGSVKSSVADSEYRPLAQLAGIITFTILYMLMWASAAVSVVLPMQEFTQQIDVILSFLYMILCIILGIFLVVFYCLARNDTRATWNTCCKTSNNTTSQPPRSSTNINVISHANAHSLKKDDDECSSLQTSSVHNQSNPLMQFMHYHKKAAMAHSVACSNSRGDASVQGSPDDAPVFFNPRQNGVAKRYWERRSRERGLNNSMMSVPESSRLHAHSPTNTEPTQHMSIEIQIKSHGSKQAKRHRLGSTNSEPADVRNNIYHSMPKSHHLHLPTAAHNKRREPTIGQSRTPSEGAPDNKQFYGQSSNMWQSSVPRNFHHRTQPSPHDSERMWCASPCEHPRAFDDVQNKQPYIHGYLRSMKDIDNSDDDDSHYSHRSKKSSQRSRHRHRHRQQTQDGESKRLTPSTLAESHASLQSHSTARSHHSSRSARSAYKQRTPRVSAEECPLLQQAPQSTHKEVEEDKLNINHSSSDNNSSHYACTPVPEAQKISNIPNIQAGGEVVYSVPQQNLGMLKVDVSGAELSALEMCIPEEGIYENARNIVPHERPVYTNLEEIRKQAIAAQALKSLEPPADEYELPVYENLFSLNEYDTLKKQKHHATKGLLSNRPGSSRDVKSPLPGAHEDSSL